MRRNLRCWHYQHYDETGEGSCPKIGQCTFVHPSEPEWATSSFGERKPSKEVGRGRGGGLAGSTRDSGVRPNRSIDSAGPSSAPPNTSWTSSDSDNTQTSAWDADDGTWGAAPTTSGWATAPSAESSSGGWGEPSPSTGGGWGEPSPSTGGGWGNDASKSKSDTAEERAGQGWGSGSGWGKPSGSGWGNTFSAGDLGGDTGNQNVSATAADKGKAKDGWDTGSGWDKPSGGSNWGGTNRAEEDRGNQSVSTTAADKGKGKDGWGSESGWGKPSGSKWGNTFSAEDLSGEDTRNQNVSKIAADKGKGKEKPPNINTTKEAQMSASFEPLTPLSPQVGRHSSVQSVREERGHVKPILVGPNARREQWEKTLRYFAAAVHAYHNLQEATKARNRYKRLQHTPELARSGPATTDKLDALNIANKMKMTDAEKAYEDRLDKLIELPDVSPAFLDMTTKVDERELKRYTEDGMTWVEDVRKKVREVCAEMPLASHARAGSVEDGEVDPDDEKLKSGSTSAKRPLDKESPPSSLSVYEALEQRISDAFEALETAQAEMEVAQSMDMRAMIDLAVEEMRKTANQAADAPDTSVFGKVKRMGAIHGESILRQAEKTASIVASHHQAEQLMQAIREQNEEKRAKLCQAQENIANLKKQVEQQAADRRILEEKVQILLGKRPPPPLTLTPELVAQVSAAAGGVIRQDVNPLMDSLHAKILGELKVHQEQNWKQAWNYMQQPLAVVEHVHGWLEKQSQK